MELQATAHNNDVLCSNGYYGFQPLLSGAGAGGGDEAGQAMALSNGHAGGLALAVCPARQRKRNRQEEATSGVANGTAAKRLCPAFYHAKLQQSMALSNGAAVLNVPLENGTDSSPIGTDSMMMVTDECEEGECPMGNGVENLHRTTGRPVFRDVATLGAAHLPPPSHTCCTTRAQLCTMSLQQSYLLSSSQTCPRCLAGEPAPYLMSIQQTVENLSKLY